MSKPAGPSGPMNSNGGSGRAAPTLSAVARVARLARLAAISAGPKAGFAASRSRLVMVSWASFGLSRAHYRALGVKIANPGMRELGERGSRALTKNQRAAGLCVTCNPTQNCPQMAVLAALERVHSA